MIVGCYPASFDFHNGSQSKLRTTSEILRRIAPEHSVVHLLPFYPSAGDFGFAPNDLSMVDTELGSWEDIQHLTKSRRCITDGIYNHVGIDHPWVRNFKTNPERFSELLHAYEVQGVVECPKSPRGPSVLVPVKEISGNWYLWKTFSDAAVDVRLESQEVIDYAIEHLDLIQKMGFWGVRLDAVAYYKKKMDGAIRHNPGVNEIAESVANLCLERDLFCSAQLNRDGEGLRYYYRAPYDEITINDFTYAIMLLISMYKGNSRFLVDYDATCIDGRNCIRAPRTHDGLLLRSTRLTDEHHALIGDLAKHSNLDVRIEADSPYELNSSLPNLYRKLFGPDAIKPAIELSMAVTAMSSGIAYYYLPYILGFEPESLSTIRDSDPRAMNRTPISRECFNSVVASGWFERASELLTVLEDVRRRDPASCLTSAPVGQFRAI